MKALIWENKSIKLVEKAKPQILDSRDAIVKVEKVNKGCYADVAERDE